MNLQIDNDALLQMAAQKIADEYADMDAVGDTVRRMIRERVDAACGKSLDDQVESALNSALSSMLDQSIQPVDIFGKPTGEATTIRGTLVSRSKDFWGTKVDASGNPMKDEWGQRNAKTRAEWMLGRIVTDEFSAQVKANAAHIASALKDAMRADAHAMIDKHLDALIKTPKR